MPGGGRDAKETIGNLPDLGSSPLLDHPSFLSFNCNVMGISEHKRTDPEKKDFLCFLFPVNSSSRQFLDKICALSSPVPKGILPFYYLPWYKYRGLMLKSSCIIFLPYLGYKGKRCPQSVEGSPSREQQA